MQTTRLRAAWVTLALCAACSSGGGNNGPGTVVMPDLLPPPPVAPSLKVVADDPLRLDGPGATRLPLMSVRDLVFRVSLPGMPSADATWVHLAVMNPMGVKVQERRFVFTTNGMHEVTVAGEIPLPMTAVPAKPIPGGWALDFSIPVGGTNMVRRPQPGLWSFLVDVDGRSDGHLEQVVELWAAQ